MSHELNSLAIQVLEQLTHSSQTVATAESCTGGLLAHTLTNIPGASAVFLEGVISYTNAAKVSLLGIAPKLIEQQGAVSLAVAQAMAEGIQKKSGATFGLATTGLAGPLGESEGKPVGTIFLAIAEKGKPTKIWKEFFPGERIAFKEKAVVQMLSHLLDYLSSKTR